ncbi:MAG: PD-(D/E)XK nuclease family protein [Salinivirgaceae bacterium]|jgi:hypothetical protein|nr:PD-(D/E)XK nuclease family protein [Salinivirgaceae bacterium]
MNNEIESILRDVYDIKEMYDRRNKETGANYNIFNVTRIKTKEVILHSRFIGDLLKPNGRHGRGNAFLKLFITELKEYLLCDVQDEECSNSETFQVLNDFSYNTAKVYIEKQIKEKKNCTGGQIDLRIEDENNNNIIIENKIYATDQKHQLVRYYNYNKSKPPLLLYLSPYGKFPDEISIKCPENDIELLREKEHFFIISYKDFILPWLEKCHELTTDFPLLRETLKQYINIVKQLTGQSINRKMDNEIIKKIIISKETAESAKLIESNYQKALDHKLGEFRLELQSSLEKVFMDNESVKLSGQHRVEKIEDNGKKIQFSLKYCENCTSNGKNLLFEISRIEKKTEFYFGFRFDTTDQNNKEYNNCKAFLSDIGDGYNKNDNWWIKKRIYKTNIKDFAIKLCDKKVFTNEKEEVTKEIKEIITKYESLIGEKV